MRTHRNAFTLIELLVVLAIVAVLLAVLLPSLAGSRQAAMHDKCLSHLRQYAVATAIYLDANRRARLTGLMFTDLDTDELRCPADRGEHLADPMPGQNASYAFTPANNGRPYMGSLQSMLDSAYPFMWDSSWWHPVSRVWPQNEQRPASWRNAVFLDGHAIKFN